jgi:predicted site-specific integrase-resolvase
MILEGQVSKIILSHKDRLLRFGSELIFMICDFIGIEINILDDKKDKTKEECA